LQTEFHKLNFKRCVEYREQQNQKIGELLVMLLNGNSLNDIYLQSVAQILPRLSFRTQIIDDIADLGEDLLAKRPSFAVGALLDNPKEFEKVSEYIEQTPNTKLKPKILHELAPDTYKEIRQKFDTYGRELDALGSEARMLRRIGDKMFDYFPVFRDIVYNYISKEAANF